MIHRKYNREYIYYKVANPWLQIKLMKLIQLFPPSRDEQDKTTMRDILGKVMGAVHAVKKEGIHSSSNILFVNIHIHLLITFTNTEQTVNHKNSFNAVFFEAIATIMHLRYAFCFIRDTFPPLINFCVRTANLICWRQQCQCWVNSYKKKCQTFVI